ncbi:MAG: TolC family protein [Candidatus Aminicenantaceae bacterium]
MLKHKKIICFFSILFLVTGVWAQKKEKALSLEDCILRAMQNNLNVAVEVLNPELADISVSLAKENFLPSLSFGYSLQNTNSRSFSFIEAEEKISTEYKDYSASIFQRIPTGGEFSISLYSYKNDSNQKFLSVNPRYSSTLRFNFTQPFLKNFGFKISRKEIIIAQNNRDISEGQFKVVLMDTIYNVESAYWNFVHSIENLKVKRQSLKLAQDLLAKNEREVEVGTLAPIEILSAQTEVASREADILQAEAMIKNNEDLLKTIINLAAEEKGVEVDIIPVDKPAFAIKEVSLEGALFTALENRPDLQASRIDVQNKEINLSYARNQLLPDLSLRASYWSPGVSGTQIVYDELDPFGPPIRTIPGESSDALRDAFDFKYKNWSVGLTLSIPLSNVLSRAEYAQARINLDQAKFRLENQEQQIFLEIKNAVRAVQTDYKRVHAYKVARELAEKKLEAEEKKLKVGLTTNYVVLQHQRGLADARSAELQAMIDYNLSLALLDKALGTTLKNKNIKFSEISEDFKRKT